MLEIGKLYKINGAILGFRSVQDPVDWQNRMFSENYKKMSKSDMIKFHREFINNQTVSIPNDSILTYLDFDEIMSYFKILYDNKILYINAGSEKFLIPID